MSIGVFMRTAKIPNLLNTAREKGLLVSLGRVLDIGSGPGRLLPLFSDSYIEEYVAVEPYEPFAREIESKLSAITSKYKVIQDKWENVKDKLLSQKWDTVLLWNSLMFMEPTTYNKEKYAEGLIDEIIDSLKEGGLFLFSLYAAKKGYYNKDELKQIYNYVVNHPRLICLVCNKNRMQAILQKV